MKNVHYAYAFPAVKPATPVNSNKYFDIGFDDENDYGFLYYKDANHEKSPIYLESAPRNPNPAITHQFYDFGLMVTTAEYNRFYNNKGQEITLPPKDIEIFEGAIVYKKEGHTYIYKASVHSSFLAAKRVSKEDGSVVFYFLDSNVVEEGDTIELV